MSFALGSFAVVVGPAGCVEADRGECREEQGPFQALVTRVADAFGFDRGARLAGRWCQPCVGGQRGGVGEGLARDFRDEDGCGPDRDSRHGGQDRVKRVGLHQAFQVFGDVATLGVQCDQLPGQVRDDQTSRVGAHDYDALFGHGGQQCGGPGGVAPGPVFLELRIDPRGAGALQLGRGGPGGQDFQHGIVFQPGSQHPLQGRVDLGEQAADPVAGLGDLPGQVQVEAGEHAQGGFVLVRDHDAAQGVGHGACRFGDDERVLFIGFRGARVHVCDPAHAQPGQVGDRDAQVLGHRDGQGADGRRLIHDHQHGALGTQLLVHGDEFGLVVGQRFVPDLGAVPGYGAGPVIGLAHVQSDIDVDITADHARFPFELVIPTGRPTTGSAVLHPRYDKRPSFWRRAPYQQSLRCLPALVATPPGSLGDRGKTPCQGWLADSPIIVDEATIKKITGLIENMTYAGIDEYFSVSRSLATVSSHADQMLIRNCRIGLRAKEGCVGHLDYLTVEHCETGIELLQQSVANIKKVALRRNGTALAIINSASHNEGGIVWGTGADANVREVYSAGASGELRAMMWTGETMGASATTGHRALFNIGNDYTQKTITGPVHEETLITGFPRSLPRAYFRNVGKHFQLSLLATITGATSVHPVQVIARVGENMLASVVISTSGTQRVEFDTVCIHDITQHLTSGTVSGAGPTSTNVSVVSEVLAGDPSAVATVNLYYRPCQSGQELTMHTCELAG